MCSMFLYMCVYYFEISIFLHMCINAHKVSAVRATAERAQKAKTQQPGLKTNGKYKKIETLGKGGQGWARHGRKNSEEIKRVRRPSPTKVPPRQFWR